MKYLLYLFLFVQSSAVFAQVYAKGDVTFTNNTSLEGGIRLDYSLHKVFVKNNFKEQAYDFSAVQRVTINRRTLDKLVFNDSTYFARQMITGRASLYQIDTNQYLVIKEDGAARTIDIKKQQNTAPGLLAVLFNDCNSIRRSLNNVDEYNGSNLRVAVQTYNNCEYQPFAPTVSEIHHATSYNTDLANFYIGIGGGLSSIRLFDSDDSEAIASIQGQLGVVATPSFFGSLQGNLYFSLEAQAALGGTNDFGTMDRDVSFRSNSFRLLLGLEYVFNKEGTFKPFIGLAVGPTGDYYEGSVDDNNFDISGGNPIAVGKIGFKYLLPNEDHIGLTLSYITDYENDLTFPTEEEIIPLVVDVQTLTLGVNYYF